jgi:ABC-type branched-subunit amino acid transport system ATPase component
MMAGQSLISVDKLTMRFGGLTALDELSMTVQEGEILGLLGPNGSGKTTFFNVLTGLYKASSGSISLDGQNILGKTPQEIYRSGVARTFQRSRLSLSLTVFDNIVIGDYQHMQHGLIFNLLRRKAFRAEYDAYVEKSEGIAGDLQSPAGRAAVRAGREFHDDRPPPHRGLSRAAESAALVASGRAVRGDDT